MKRGSAIIATAALVTVAAALLPAHSGSATPVSIDSSGGPACPSLAAGSVLGHGFAYCGYHWKSSRLPVRLALSTENARPSARDFELAARAAAATWDAAWPGWGRAPRTASCALARAICVDSVTAAPLAVNASDGVNVVVWRSLGRTGDLGRAYVTVAASRITDVDVVLNADASWFWVTGASDGKAATVAQGNAAGEAAGALGGLCPRAACADATDLEGIAMHEFGHVLGLEDVGGTTCFAADLTDAADYLQTMYACDYKGSTNKRTPDWGDLAGVARVAADSALDS